MSLVFQKGKTALRLTKPYIQWGPRAHVLGGVKRPGRETGHSPALNAQLPHMTEWRAYGNKKKQVALIMLIIALQFDVSTSFNM